MKNRLQVEDIQDIKKGFQTSDGRKALEVLNRLFYNTISYSMDSSHKTAFNEGHRDVIQFINNCVRQRTVREEEKINDQIQD